MALSHHLTKAVRAAPAIWLIAAASVLGLPAFGSAQVVTASRSLVVRSEPGAVVWIDGIRFGKTTVDGALTITALSKSSHLVRVRADGFKEVTRTVPRTAREINIVLARTTDPAELAYQEAERLSLRDRELAAAAYRKAIKLRPGYVWAYIGLARVLFEADDVESAARTIREIRRFSPRNAEASAIEGRVLNESGEQEKAIAAFKRSIAEGRGFQPEAYTGLGLLYKDRAEGFGGSGDFAQEEQNYNEAAKYLKTALGQLSGAPDAAVLFQLLGLVYERQRRYNEAIRLYEEFLAQFPDSNDAPAVRSFIVQLKKQMATPD
jgi:tetratricopeptide (TPR) repeat protein